jgi:hypothetical protein
MYLFFEEFAKKMMASFRRIVKAAKHDVTEEDLKQDAWVLAQDIGTRRGREVDFSDPADQDLIIRAVNKQNVERGDWQMRNAVRIVSESEDGESMQSLVEQLPAQASSDPLISILLRESAHKAETILMNSYSQAVAYVRAFANFRNNRQEICAYLVISDGTLNRRIGTAAETFRLQPSLFDCIERISKDFIPRHGKQYAAIIAQHLSGSQWAWEF